MMMIADGDDHDDDDDCDDDEDEDTENNVKGGDSQHSASTLLGSAKSIFLTL